MNSPVLRKLELWTEDGKGFKSVLSSEVESPALERDDLASPLVRQKLKRGKLLQRMRLQYYPTIDVERDNLFAGYIEGTLDDAKERLHEMGYRNNPTAYVEVTDEHGPDDGSFARQYITETSASQRRPILHNRPTIFRREKQQIHVCIFSTDDRVEFLAHDESSAWLQPARHIAVSAGNARIGVRDFRDDWYDEYEEELGGREQVRWSTAH